MTSYAKPEYTKKEKKGCTFAMSTQGKKDLNDAGKCYAEHDHSLDACAHEEVIPGDSSHRPGVLIQVTRRL